MQQSSFQRLFVWRKAQELIQVVYEVTKTFPPLELKSLVNQLRRAAVSVSSNIAEGANRRTLPDRRRYIMIAYGSALEIEAQIHCAYTVGYLSDAEFEKSINATKHVLRLLNCYYKKPIAERHS